MSGRHDNDSDHIRRSPQDTQGKLRAGGGDLIGDEEDQVEEWDDLIAEEQGQYDSRIGETDDLNEPRESRERGARERRGAAGEHSDRRSTS